VPADRVRARRAEKVGRPDPAGDPPLPARRGALAIVEDESNSTWIELEDGVQVQFLPGQRYRPGDHWLIPARTLIEDVLWPREDDGTPTAQRPRGVTHHYAPLAALTTDGDGALADLRHMRRGFTQWAT
jgi:hypothetical protein